jgi:hypothetical protein
MSEPNSPYGYEAITPLRSEHRINREAALSPTARRMNSVPVVVSEVEPAGARMPVVFAPVPAGNLPSGYTMLAIMGLVEEENVFLEADGRWTDNAYIPAYFRRMPFCTLGTVQNGQPTRVMCVEERALATEEGSGVPVAVDGQPTEGWKQTELFVLGFEQQLGTTQEALKLLVDMKLIEHFTMNATLPDGSPMQFSGVARINEAVLKELNAQQLRLLFDRGLMRLIYAHLLSLERFTDLLRRRTLRTGNASTPAVQQIAA